MISLKVLRGVASTKGKTITQEIRQTDRIRTIQSAIEKPCTVGSFTRKNFSGTIGDRLYANRYIGLLWIRLISLHHYFIYSSANVWTQVSHKRDSDHFNCWLFFLGFLLFNLRVFVGAKMPQLNICVSHIRHCTGWTRRLNRNTRAYILAFVVGNSRYLFYITWIHLNPTTTASTHAKATRENAANYQFLI